jgi:hypothetical protein
MQVKKAKEKKKYESVKIEQSIVESVRAYVKTTKQSISGFFTLAVLDKLPKNSKKRLDSL